MFYFLDIVLDNAGYEVFTDLCLADYLISKNLCKINRFYVKNIPWFISDVMTHDFHWLLHQLAINEDENLNKLAQRWKNYLQEGIWKIEESDFWTLPFDFTYMANVDPRLYKQLSETKIVIFKGELKKIGLTVTVCRYGSVRPINRFVLVCLMKITEYIRITNKHPDNKQ